jgi:hypothetical protein
LAVNLDLDNEILLADQRRGCQHERQQNKHAVPDGLVPPNSCGGRRWRPSRLSLRARVVAESRGPHRDYLMTAMNCNYLEKLELGKR